VTTTTLVERFNGNETGGAGRVTLGTMIGGVESEDNEDSEVDGGCLVEDKDLSMTFKSKSNVIK